MPDPIQQTTTTTPPPPSPTPTEPSLAGTEAKPSEPPIQETAEAKAAREATEKKAAEDKTAADKKAADDAAAAKANDTKLTPFKPDEIKFTTEGVSVDNDIAVEFTKWVNDNGIPRDKALELVKLQEKTAKLGIEKWEKGWKDLETQWRDTVTKDAEIGGEKLQASQTLLAKAINMYSEKMKMNPGEVRQAFDLTGAGNNPHLFKLFVGMARDLVKEGGPVNSGGVTGPQPTLAQLMFDKGHQK